MSGVNDDALRLAARRAQADRRRALVSTGLDGALLAKARDLLAKHDSTDAWAILTVRTATELGCTTPLQRFAVELLAEATIRLAGATPAPADSPHDAP